MEARNINTSDTEISGPQAPIQLNAYLKLGDKITSLHETPDGGWVYGGNRDKIDLSKIREGTRRTIVNSMPSFSVNQTAMALLKLSDGTLTGKEVLSKIATKFDVDLVSAKEAIEPFVKTAFRLEHLIPSCQKNPRDIIITGSPDYFMPVHISFELTEACNFKCDYCYRSAKLNKNLIVPTLSNKQVLGLLEKLSKGGVKVIELTGGEPLLHPNIIEIIDYCGRNFNLCALLTNGSLVTEKVATALADAGNFIIGVSLDGSTEEYVDKASGVAGSFKKICKGIKLLGKHNLLVRAGMTVVPENIDDIENTALLAKELDVTAFAAAPVMSMGRAKDVKQNKKDRYRFLMAIHKIQKDFPELMLTMSEASQQYAAKIGNCGAGHRSFVISANGDVRGCLINTQKWSVVGNLIDQDYKDVFVGPKVKFYRELKWPKQEICGECEMFWYCGNCAMRGIQTALEMKPDCIWAKDQGVWEWISNTEDLQEISACHKSYNRK